MSVKIFKKVVGAAVVAVVVGVGFLGCAGSEAIKSAPSIDAVTGINDKLLWLRHNAKSGGDYVIEVNSNEIIKTGFATYVGSLTYKEVSNITLTLKNSGSNVTIRRDEAGALFEIGSGVTLILEGDLTLRGIQYNPGSGIYGALVSVRNGGTLVMNDGVTITGNINNSGNGSGGVYVGAGGTFHMKGGTISGNTTLPGPQAMQSKIAGNAAGRSLVNAAASEVNTAVGNEVLTTSTRAPTFSSLFPNFGGGGVYVSGAVAVLIPPSKLPSGTFIKTGGTITDNVVRDPNGNIVSGMGNAVYFGASSGNQASAIETTIGPDVHLSFSNGQLSEQSAPAAPVMPQVQEVPVESQPVESAVEEVHQSAEPDAEEQEME